MSMAMDDLISTAARKYQEIIELQGGIKQKPRKLKTMSFELLDEDEKVKLHEEYYHKENVPHDHSVIQKYLTYLKKYNNTAEVLNKVSKFLRDMDEDFMLEFEIDKENYTTIAIAPYGGIHSEEKIYLWKSTYTEPDYIKYRFTPLGDCKIVKIFSQERPIGHKSFMLEMLFKAVEEYNSKTITEKYESVKDVRQVISRVIADLSENNEEERVSYFNFFRKKDFVFKEDGVYKMMSK